ncbi:hypothetical protein HHK36_028136 [Tetracentron sinense]|uniref:DUF7745 domain-containing protein n=1 Tax=Tetracentron sinense TaxID=13715 RepID=A0A834YEB7_TETSI|nr:hypothetical protein HHK36_028136 [Tetracentron sinense]
MDSLDSSEQEAFHKLKLGNVASFFDVKINGHLVEALLGGWSPEFHVFRLGVFELSPTLEEYGRLLSVPFDQDKIVLPTYRASWKTKVSSFVGVKRGFLEKLDGEENYFRCSLKFLIDYLSLRNPSWISTPSFVGPPGSWPQYCFRALALAIVGHVLLPLSFNYIDMQILEVVEQIMTGHSFIPMLLVETFRALDRCVQKRGGFFRGCISLLQIWLLEHLKFCNPLATPAFMRQDLIESHCSFSDIPPFLDSPEMWYDQLIMLAPDMLGIPVIEAIKDVVEFGPSSEKLISRLLAGWKSRVKTTFGDDQESRHRRICQMTHRLLSPLCFSSASLCRNAGLKAEVAKMGIEAVAYQDRIRDLKAQVDVLETVNEEFYTGMHTNRKKSRRHQSTSQAESSSQVVEPSQGYPPSHEVAHGPDHHEAPPSSGNKFE